MRAICQRVEINFVIMILPSLRSAAASIYCDTVQLFADLVGVALPFQAVFVHDLTIAQKDDSVRVSGNARIMRDQDHCTAPIIGSAAEKLNDLFAGV